MALEYATLLRSRGELGEADQVLESALAAGGNVQLLGLLAEIKLARQDWVGAAQVAEALKRFDFAAEQARQVEGLALVGQNRFDEGLASLKDVYQSAENKNRPMVTLVGSYLRTGRGDEALEFLDSVLQATPDNALAQVLKARALRATGQLSAASDAFKDYLAQFPEDVGVYAELSGFTASRRCQSVRLK